MNNSENISNININKFPMESTDSDNFVDVFFDKPIATDENIVNSKLESETDNQEVSEPTNEFLLNDDFSYEVNPNLLNENSEDNLYDEINDLSFNQEASLNNEEVSNEIDSSDSRVSYEIPTDLTEPNDIRNVNLEIEPMVDDKTNLANLFSQSNNYDLEKDVTYESSKIELPKLELDKNNLSQFIDSLASNVKIVSDYINGVVECKDSLELKSQEIDDKQKKLDLQVKHVDEYVQGEKLRLESEMADFKDVTDKKNSELVLLEEKLIMERQQLDNEKQQFERFMKNQKEVIENEYSKLEDSRKQSDKEIALLRESLDNSSKELEAKVEEFNKYKEFEERKLELESKNLAKSCTRFKTIVAQLNNDVEIEK